MQRPARLKGFGPVRVEGVAGGLRIAWERVCFGWRARWRLLRVERTYWDRENACWVTEVEGWRMKMPGEGAGTGPSGGHAKVTTGLMRFPLLAKCLTSRKYDGTDQSRDGGMVSVTARNGMWMVTLKEPTALLKLTVEVECPTKVWEALEAILGHDPVPWVTDPYARPIAKMKPRK